METKINIATILKDKPENTKLYSPLFGYVYFLGVEDGIIKVTYQERLVIFFGDGRYYNYPESEPLLFPSKEMRDWSKFARKKGDALIKTTSEYCVGIFDKWTSDDYSTFSAKYINLGLSGNFSCSYTCKTEEWEKMENSKNYISEIERVMNGKLNLQTLEIQTQLEFKDGDIAFADYGNRQDVFIVSDKTNLSEGYSSFISLDLSSLTLSMGYRTCFFKKDLCKLRLATDSEKKQLFSALEKEGKVWDAEKKMIVNLKPKVELKPFDNVLVRHQKTEEWRANIFSHTDKTDEYLDYVCVNGRWEFCIPYEGNESLLGTTKDVED